MLQDRLLFTLDRAGLLMEALKRFEGGKWL